jgi:hypothetical protein
MGSRAPLRCFPGDASGPRRHEASSAPPVGRFVSASTGGMGHPADVAVRILAFVINQGIAVETTNQLSILPADVAADNIATITKSQ